MMKIRGALVDHSPLGRWVVKFSKLIEKQVRRHKAPVSKSWKMDETYINLNGKWIYLYRAVDKFGNTIDFYFGKKGMHRLQKLSLKGLFAIMGNLRK